MSEESAASSEPYFAPFAYTEVDLFLPSLANTRCGYCHKYGHTAAHHPDYEGWKTMLVSAWEAKQKATRKAREEARRLRETEKKRKRAATQPVETECLWCKKVFEHAPSVYRKYCSRQCFSDHRRSKNGWPPKRLDQETPKHFESVECQLHHAPGQGFEMADLDSTLLLCHYTGETTHPFTTADLEDIHPLGQPSEWSSYTGFHLFESQTGLWEWLNAENRSRVRLKQADKQSQIPQDRKPQIRIRKTPCRAPDRKEKAHRETFNGL